MTMGESPGAFVSDAAAVSLMGPAASEVSVVTLCGFPSQGRAGDRFGRGGCNGRKPGQST